MKKHLAGALMVAAAFFLLTPGLSSCAKPQAQPASNPSDLVMTACTACHSAQRICDSLGKKDKDAWNATVTRMVEKGANVPKENIPELVEYLARLKPGSPPVCK